MKSVLVIGLGRFGCHLCSRFMDLGNEVMAVDVSEARVNSLADVVTSVRIADCTEEAALRELDVRSYDLCFVCIGSDFASTLMITAMLYDAGAKHIVAKASADMEAKLLLRNGASEIVHPERDSAERLAARMSARNVFDYIELTEEYSIYEIPLPAGFAGHTIAQLDVRNRYHINILAVKTGDKLNPLPGAAYRFTGTEHLLALASRDVARTFLKSL